MTLKLITLCLMLWLVAAPAAFGQDGSQLSQYFVGKSVVVKLDMPASQQGIDVYPQRNPPVDYGAYAQRLKRFGTALRTGDSIVITKVTVKGKLIEFQLGGGGYGTFWDDSNTTVAAPTAGKSSREKDLERQLKSETDPKRRKWMKDELDRLRRDRERRDGLNQALAAQASEAKQARIDERRLQGGSRFNIRYEPGLPPEALTPEAVISALGQYLTFPGESSGAAVAGQEPRDNPAAADPVAGLRKGMTRAEVESLLGEPTQTSEKTQDGLQVTTCTFQRNDALIQGDFVNGVLVRFTISSR